MTYFPTEPPELNDVGAVREWLRDELRSISAELQETDAIDLRARYVAPNRPRVGMIVYADGTSWNPNRGEGPYTYRNGVWVPLFPSGSLGPGTTTNDDAVAGDVGEFVIGSNAEPGSVGSLTGTSGVTITIASPAVVTWPSAIPFKGSSALTFSTTGALPTGITAATNYYVIGSSISGNTFQIATSIDNAVAGTAISTSGSQSGTHSGIPHLTLTTNTFTNLAGVSLTAGDWDVAAMSGFLGDASTSETLFAASISTASASFQNFTGGRSQVALPATVPGNLGNEISHLGPRRISIAATTTIYLVVFATFTLGVLHAWGGLQARRMR